MTQDGESILVIPEESQKEAPPSYAVAQADQVPAYYETVIHAPSLGLDGEILVEGMRKSSVHNSHPPYLFLIIYHFQSYRLFIHICVDNAHITFFPIRRIPTHVPPSYVSILLSFTPST